MNIDNENFVFFGWFIVGQLLVFGMNTGCIDIPVAISWFESVGSMLPLYRSLMSESVFNVEFAKTYFAICTILSPIMALTFFMVPNERWWRTERSKKNAGVLVLIGIFTSIVLYMVPVEESRVFGLLAKSSYGFAFLAMLCPLLLTHTIRSICAYIWLKR